MSTDTLTPRLQRLLATLSEAERKRLAQRIAADLRAANAKRMAAQQAPDRTAWEPRKPQSSRYPAAQGKIRRALFERLRDARHLKIRSATAAAVDIGFSQRDEAIARIHHYGLVDAVSARLRIRYPIRQLIGITDPDRETIAKTVLDHVAG